MPRRRVQLALEDRLFALALLAGLPGTLVTLVWMATGGFSTKVQWTVGLLVVGVWASASLAVRERVVRPLQTLSNLLAALREGDYSVRGRNASRDDALGDVMWEVNALSEYLRSARLSELEAEALLHKVMEEIDVAVLAFDGAQRLRLINRAGARLLGKPETQLLKQTAGALGLAQLLEGDAPRTIDQAIVGPTGRWELRRSLFRQEGLSHTLVVLADLRRALREEERQAWQRLVRVLSHEINNSLAPIHSIATGLQDVVKHAPKAEWVEDLERGLAVVARRSESLSRFMASYAQLARLPPPKLAPVEVEPLLHRVAALEKRLPVAVRAGPSARVRGDADQLEQLLINLIRNAVDASLETGGGVTLSWKEISAGVEICVADQGHGIADTKNLFVPFFTTKPQGSGIGLVLCRQIAEAHHGSLSLANAPAHAGCEARLRLPVALQSAITVGGEAPHA